MVIAYRVVILLSTGTTYAKMLNSKEDRDTLFSEIQNALSSGVGTLNFNQDIPPGTPIQAALVVISVPQIVAIEKQDVKISD